jgi:predicted membrane-bound spermidine synthase
MTAARNSRDSLSIRLCLYALVTVSGLAALSWETLWQLRAGLALGVSAWGTGLTLAVTMGGMGLGALLSGKFLAGKTRAPLRLYGVLESVIGASGLLLPAAFACAENLDTYFYHRSPSAAPLTYALSLAAILALPAICMGATLPALGLAARQWGASLALLYGLNTLGAAAGAMLMSFVLIPALGLSRAGLLAAAVNLAVAFCAWLMPEGAKARTAPEKGSAPLPPGAFLLAATTGFAVLALEIAWFRSLTAAFTSTTASFAIMLSVVLLALGAAAAGTGFLKVKNFDIGLLTAAGGILVLLATPLVERFDLVDAVFYGEVLNKQLNRFALTLYVIGPPVLLLGLALPRLLDDAQDPRTWGKLYAVNTCAAIIGALSAAWLLLPVLGFARTAWLAGALAAAAGTATAGPRRRPVLVLGACAALLLAVLFDSGAGRTRVQGHITTATTGAPHLLEYFEGPEATVSAVSYDKGGRALIIDGFVAASQFDPNGRARDHYMAWMGALPMLLHPGPENALVICFGTGQTANAVRKENPKSLDIVDVNPRVFRLAHNFYANQQVLEDTRAHAVVLDGRAWLRHTDRAYDVITLEPMPPNFAGVNALYSREFYELAARRLAPNGIIAQWLPVHFVGPQYVAAIARSFIDVFPNALLWVDPGSGNGILLGTVGKTPLGRDWPGFTRNPIPREYADKKVRDAVTLDQAGLARLARGAEPITDDNQALAYGRAVFGVTQQDIAGTKSLIAAAEREK